MTTEPITISKIIANSDTQFRTELIENNVEDMIDLIERGVPFKAPIRLSRFNDSIYLTDGFHRLEAFKRLGISEIPADRYEITEAATLAEVHLKAVSANAQHGKGYSEKDYYHIIRRMMASGDYMKNAFEPDVKKIADAIGAPHAAVKRGYGNYQGTTAKPYMSLSAQCKYRRDNEIRKLHAEGKSVNAIAKMLNVGRATVDNAVRQGPPVTLQSCPECDSLVVYVAKLEPIIDEAKDSIRKANEAFDKGEKDGQADMEKLEANGIKAFKLFEVLCEAKTEALETHLEIIRARIESTTKEMVRRGIPLLDSNPRASLSFK